MPSITLAYGSGAATSRTFSKALSVKGFRAGDHHIQFPGLRPVYLNGNVRKKQANFRRVFTLDLGIVTNANDLSFLGLFLNNEFQYLTYAMDDLHSETNLRVVDDHSEWESQWEGGVEVGRRIVLRLEEADARTTYPVQSGYGFDYGSDYGDAL